MSILSSYTSTWERWGSPPRLSVRQKKPDWARTRAATRLEGHAAGYGLHEEAYTAEIDDAVMYLPIIETAASIAHIDDIMAVDGVDGCIVGPVDLCISLGIPFKFDHPTYLDALQRVREAAQRTGKPAGHPLVGSLNERDNIRRQVEEGVRLLLIGGDEPYLAAACRQALDDHAFLNE